MLSDERSVVECAVVLQTSRRGGRSIFLLDVERRPSRFHTKAWCINYMFSSRREHGPLTNPAVR